MGENNPDTDRSGIERRDVMKGLGFGAMGMIGAGAFAGKVAAQDGQFNRIGGTDEIVDYGLLVEAGGDAELSSIPDSAEFSDGPDGAMDLVFQLDSPGMEQNGSKTIAYQVAFVRQNGDNTAATKSVAEGRTRGFAGTVQTNPGGETQHREEFSTSGLQSGNGSTSYWAVLTVADYSGIDDSLPVDAGVIPFSVASP